MNEPNGYLVPNMPSIESSYGDKSESTARESDVWMVEQ